MNLLRKMAGFWGFSALVALISAAWLLSIPSETYAGMPLGLSPVRLGMLAMLLAALALSLLLAAVLWRGTRAPAAMIDRWKAWLAPLCVAVFLPAVFLSLLPASQAGVYASSLVRARPLLVYAAAVSGVAALTLAGWRFGWQPSKFAQTIRAQARTLRIAAALLLAALAVVALAFITGFGVRPDTQGWNNPSVPVSSLQLLALLLGLFGLALAFGPRLAARISPTWHWRDTALVVLLWAAAALIWNLAPLPAGFFAPGPYPPDYQYHPFSDAAQFSNGAQYLLLGEGLNSNSFTDRPVYLAFLALLYAIAGQRYDAVIGLQVSVLAAAPAVLYGLGRHLHSRPAGLLAAALLVAQEVNVIQATRTQSVSHVRWMMTEFPAMLMMALALLAFMLAYARRPYWPYLAISGGLLAVAAMVRANPLFAFLGCLVFWFLTHVKTPRRAFAGSVVMVIGFLLCAAPWMARTTIRNNVTLFFMPKLENVIYRRFERGLPPAPDPASRPAYEPLPGNSTTVTIPPAPTSTPAQRTGSPSTLATRARIVAQHSLHTALSALFVLPAHPDLTFLTTALQHYPYTDTGMLSPPAGTLVMLVLNLAVICLGAALAWRKLGWAGLAPLALFFSLCLSNGVARSSGGRYQVGSDWVMLVYFALGVAEIGSWLLAAFRWPAGRAPKRAPTTPAAGRLLAAGMVLVVLIGASPALAELAVPRRPVRTAAQVLAQPGVEALLPASAAEIEQFAQSEGAIVRYGRLLYPRYYFHDRGEPTSDSPYRVRAYPRLVFELLSNTYKTNAILPLPDIPDLASGATAMVIGCETKRETQVHTLIIFAPGEPRVYTRDPYAELQCPIPEPVCDNNHNCR